MVNLKAPPPNTVTGTGTDTIVRVVTVVPERLRRVPILRDGHCLFRAIALAMVYHGDATAEWTAQDVRNQVADFYLTPVGRQTFATHGDSQHRTVEAYAEV